MKQEKLSTIEQLKQEIAIHTAQRNELAQQLGESEQQVVELQQKVDQLKQAIKPTMYFVFGYLPHLPEGLGFNQSR